MAEWDTDSPADSDIVSQYPGNERAARAAVQSNFGVDHHETDDADVGKHEKVTLLEQASDPSFGADEVGIYHVGDSLRARNAAGAAQRIVRFDSGTRQVFYNASAPTGWTQNTALNDRVLRVVDGEGGSTGGDGWDFSGAVNVDGHTLSLSEIPNRTGSFAIRGDEVNIPIVSEPSGTFSISKDAVGSKNTVDRAGQVKPRDRVDFDLGGGGESHSHGVSGNTDWRPDYIDVIVASVD